MRKAIVVLAGLAIFFVSEAGFSAETKGPSQKSGIAPGSAPADVAMRFSRHEGFSRVVFEAPDEAFITNTTVTPAQNQIRIQFPSPFSLRQQGNVDLQTSLKGNTYIITVNAPFRIKTLRLSGPPRLSLDIIAATKEEVRKAAVPEVTSGSFPAVKVVIDPGHGGYDIGIISGDSREKDFTFSLARSMEAALIRKNRAVSLTRRADQFLSITDRAIFANQKSPDVFLSIHLSLADNFVIYTSSLEPASPESSGEIYNMMSRQRLFVERSRALAEGLAKALKEDFNREVVFRKMDLPLLASVGAPSVLVELPVAAASDQSLKTKIAESLLRGVASYAGQ